jgi:polyferredoxin
MVGRIEVCWFGVLTVLWVGLVVTVLDVGRVVCPVGNPVLLVVEVVDPVSVVVVVGGSGPRI